MTMTNAEWLIKNGYLFSDVKHWCQIISEEMYFSLNGKTVGKVKMIGNSYFESFKKWLDQEHKEPILTDEEHEYLAAVIKPYRSDVFYIVKHRSITPFDNFEHIEGINSDMYSDDISYYFILPRFKSGTKYKGMEPNKLYSIKDLDL